MPTTLGRHIKRRFAVPYACYKLIATRRSFIRQSGWIDSIRSSSPRDSEGMPIPWINYPMVELLRERLGKSHRVFEFGSGFSTCFFGELCQQITSVEYDEHWVKQVRTLAPANSTVIFQPYDIDGEYCRVVTRTDDTYHLIVVDGQDRVNCMRQSLSHLTDDGILLLDDSDREIYGKGFAAMQAAGFKHLSIGGIKPGSPSRHQATLFYRENNCFDI